MDNLLQQGVTAFRSGKRDEARKFFIAAVKQNQNDERAWVWLYNVCGNDKERIHCLKRIILINPKNEMAKIALSKFKDVSFPNVNQIISNEKDSHQEFINESTAPIQKNRTDLIILITTVFLIAIISIGVIYLSIGREKRTSIVYQITPTIKKLPPTWTPVYQSTEAAPLTPMASLYGGPARKYIPISNMEKTYGIGHDIEENYITNDGEFYKIGYSEIGNDGFVNLDQPRISFFSYVGDDLENAKKFFRRVSENYSVEDTWTDYKWVENKYESEKFDEIIQFIGIRKDGGIFGESGRVIRKGDIVVLINIEIRNLDGINDSDIYKLNQELNKYTKMVEEKLPN